MLMALVIGVRQDIRANQSQENNDPSSMNNNNPHPNNRDNTLIRQQQEESSASSVRNINTEEVKEESKQNVEDSDAEHPHLEKEPKDKQWKKE
jgi:hypothetical protein